MNIFIETVIYPVTRFLFDLQRANLNVTDRTD